MKHLILITFVVTILILLTSCAKHSDHETVDEYPTVDEIAAGYLEQMKGLDDETLFPDRCDKLTFKSLGVYKYTDVVRDPLELYDTSTGLFTAPENGVYNVTALLTTANVNWVQYELFVLSVHINGVEKQQKFFRAQAAMTAKSIPNLITAQMYLNKDDTLGIYTRKSGTATTGVTTSVYNYLSISKLPSPQDVANMIVGFNLATEDRPGLVPSYEQGTWTPSITGITNISSSTARLSMYQRIGDIVFGSFTIDVSATSTGDTQGRIDLPISSNFTSQYDVSGGGAAMRSTGTPGVGVFADTSNDEIQFRYNAPTTLSMNITVSFTYLVK